jgi:hypothetical protein
VVEPPPPPPPQALRMKATEKPRAALKARRQVPPEEADVHVVFTLVPFCLCEAFFLHLLKLYVMYIVKYT